jgi:hypothetical protein
VFPLRDSANALRQFTHLARESPTKSRIFNNSACKNLAYRLPIYHSGGVDMITLEVHPEVHVHEQIELPRYSTCFECHRSYRAKTEQQLAAGLCAHCFDARHFSDPLISVHVKVLPRKPLTL